MKLIFVRSVAVLVVSASIMTADDPVPSVRGREASLAKALRSGSNALLADLVDEQFHFTLTCGSAIHSFTYEMNRQDWVTGVSTLKTRTYSAFISKLQVSRARGTGCHGIDGRELKGAPTLATVFLVLVLVVVSQRGKPSEKRLRTMDTWDNRNGAWKLVGRHSSGDPWGCGGERGF